MGYSPPLSLWRLVEQHVQTHERDEIKSMLGVGVVDETLELHEELHAFLEIWRDCRCNSQKTEEYVKSTRLPEPPGMRDRLVQEIRFFIENVKEKAQEQGSDDSGVLNRYNQNIISYATNGESRASSIDPLMMRPQSVIGRDGKETPSLRYGSPASDRISSSTYSTLSEDVEAMADKLNIIKLDEIVSHLRNRLSEEKEWLVQDLKFLQECIEDENDATSVSHEEPAEPSIGELREERLKLEKDMLSDVFMHQKPLCKGITHLKPVSANKRVAVVPTNGPLKAIHTTAPDGIVLSGNVPDSVIIKAQQKLADNPLNVDSNNAFIVQVDTYSSMSGDTSLHDTHIPVSSTGSTSRPSTARRFRSMVMGTRSSMGDS